jgi:hypothetical protein
VAQVRPRPSAQGSASDVPFPTTLMVDHLNETEVDLPREK